MGSENSKESRLFRSKATVTNRTSISYTPPTLPQAQGPLQRRRKKNILQSNVREDQSQTVTPGHDRAAVLRDPQQLRVPAHG